MKRLTLTVLSLLLLFATVAAHPSPEPVTSEDLVIQVAPQTIILGRDANQGNVWVTIHAEIDFSSAYIVSVEIEGNSGQAIDAEFTFADNRGDLVAKFSYDDVAYLVGPGEATLTMAGYGRIAAWGR
jgi:hypothetical protein